MLGKNSDISEKERKKLLTEYEGLLIQRSKLDHEWEKLKKKPLKEQALFLIDLYNGLDEKLFDLYIKLAPDNQSVLP